jgi:DNA (cytosine-5)-methyltransferase 1
VKKNKPFIKAKVVDLFCGIGGLTHGFELEGLDVVAGVDFDDTCTYGYERNNKAKFIHKNIADFTSKELNALYGDSELKILVGCAPCQPYSGLNRKKGVGRNKTPLEKFAELVEATQPHIVSMENVRGLANKDKYPEFSNFLKVLKNNKYEVSYQVVDTSDYGVPQKRNRLVLLASKFGEISLLPATHTEKKVTVRDTIGSLDPIEDGETSKKDRLHKASKLSPLNKMRIQSTPKDGGNSDSWDESLLPECYKKDSGKTYRGTVYGRMRWDDPAPTMTTQCTGLGNGRFGHPEQDRAISLREAALIQTFPNYYQFVPEDSDVISGHISKFIGNAVPVRLGAIIAKSIKAHLNNYVSSNYR